MVDYNTCRRKRGRSPSNCNSRFQFWFSLFIFQRSLLVVVITCTVDGSQKRNRPFFSCVLSYLAMNSSRRLEMTLLWYRPLCFSHLNAIWLAWEQLDLHNKSSEVCIKTRSPPASLPYKGLVTEQTTVNWSISPIFSSMTRSDQSRASENIWWILSSGVQVFAE